MLNVLLPSTPHCALLMVLAVQLPDLRDGRGWGSLLTTPRVPEGSGLLITGQGFHCIQLAVDARARRKVTAVCSY
jgi:hypothetical protein